MGFENALLKELAILYQQWIDARSGSSSSGSGSSIDGIVVRNESYWSKWVKGEMTASAPSLTLWTATATNTVGHGDPIVGLIAYGTFCKLPWGGPPYVLQVNELISHPQLPPSTTMAILADMSKAVIAYYSSNSNSSSDRISANCSSSSSSRSSSRCVVVLLLLLLVEVVIALNVI